MSSYGVTAHWGSGIGSGRGNIGSMSGFGITRQTFQSIENFIRDNEQSIVKANIGLDLLARTMILVIKGYAQMKSGGPVAPRHRSVPALANRIPVQRITGDYFAGWKHRKIGTAHWMLYNDSKEAWLVEYGIHQRTRRPILKMSLIGMLQFIQVTRTADRFLADVLAPRRNKLGQFQSFATRAQPAAAMGGLAGPSGVLP